MTEAVAADDPASQFLSVKERLWLRALEQVAHALKMQGVNFFLDTGTLLGAARDGRFIPWDNDIDLGIVGCSSDDPRLMAVIATLCRGGFMANRSMTGVGFFDPQGIEVNLKLYEEAGEVLVGDYSYYSHPFAFRTFLYNIAAGHHLSSHGQSLKYRIKALLISARPLLKNFLPLLALGINKTILVAKVTKADVLPLGKVSLYDIPFPAPHDLARYLSGRYGANWETPVRDYDYMRDDLSISSGQE